MRTIKATERLTIEVPCPGEVDCPLSHVKVNDVEDQAVIVYSEEIRHLVMALSEAAGVLAEVWGCRLPGVHPFHFYIKWNGQEVGGTP